MNATKRFATVTLMALFTSACVTINIYFPAAAAEEAARMIVRDVLELQGDPAAEPNPEPEPSSSLPESARSVALLAWTLERLVAPAAAQQPNLQVDTPATKRLRASMRARIAELAPHLRSGAIGFGNDGFVAVRDLSLVSLRERAQVQRLVNEENADRTALYREIARANDRPDWEGQIRETFARVWVEEAPAGFWHQDTRGAWRQK
jgi:uncharacterized protein YdbL (DUF1318 family)